MCVLTVDYVVITKRPSHKTRTNSFGIRVFKVNIVDG